MNLHLLQKLRFRMGEIHHYESITLFLGKLT